MVLNNGLLKKSFLFFVFVELFSLISYVYPETGAVAFFVVLGLALAISLYSLEFGLYFVIAELFVGSFGQLFSYAVDGFSISLRIGIFIVVMAVWFGKYANLNGFNIIKRFLASRIGKLYLVFGIVLVAGFVNGTLRNDFGNVFLDFNNWLYFLYVLPFYSVFSSEHFCKSVSKSTIDSKKDLTHVAVDYGKDSDCCENIQDMSESSNNSSLTINILSVLASALAVLFIQTIVLEWFFAHQVSGVIEMLYRWIRDFRIGEITLFAGGFYRIFIQSQIWSLIGFFIFLGLWTSRYVNLPKKKWVNFFSLIVLMSSITLIISLSRSMWLGWVAGFVVYVAMLVFLKYSYTRIITVVVAFCGALMVSGVFIFSLISIPPAKEKASFGVVVSDRITVVEAAGSSRINLLGPLWDAVLERPIFGKGFGSVVTYKSVDPRVLNSTAGASGEYTTYAFEWSYLDMWLKVGFVGLLAYLLLLFEIARLVFLKIKALNGENKDYGLLFGILLAMVSLVVTNVFTPYLNHPLGIGFVIIATVIILEYPGNLRRKKEYA